MTTIDLRTIPASTPSLCIPRVFANIGEQRIRRIFDELNMGEIDRVDIISKTTEKGDKFNRVFIHFKRWSTDGNAEKARQRLLNGQDIKIVYDDPWFWKISAYRPPVPSLSQHSNRRPQQKAPRLELDEKNESPRPVDHPRNDHQRRPAVDHRRHPKNDQRRPVDHRRPRNDQRNPEVQEDPDCERPLDPQELAQHEDIIQKSAAVAAELGIQSEPAVSKQGAALKNLLKKSLTIETDNDAP